MNMKLIFRRGCDKGAEREIRKCEKAAENGMEEGGETAGGIKRGNPGWR